MRRAAFGLLTASMAVAACGRIVTIPKTDQGSSLVPAGNMFIRYRTLGALDPTNINYLVVFNTTGNGNTPYAGTYSSTYTDYSFILIFGATAAAGSQYAVFQVYNSGSGGFSLVQLPINPAFVTNFNANSSGSNNEFTFTFNRNLLAPIVTSSPSPLVSPTPTDTPTNAAGIATKWAINCFSAQASNNTIIDGVSPIGGKDNTSFSLFVVDTTQPFDQVSNKANPPPVQVNPQSAQIMSVEIINVP